MTKNTKAFATATTALNALQAQMNTEAKADPRFSRAKKRAERLVSGLSMMLKKYEIVHGRKVPTKIAERKAGAKKTVKKVAKKTAKKKAAKPIESNVVQLKTAAASRSKQAVKRSK